MICGELGLKECDFTNGAAYIADCLGKLRDDKREVFRAAADAQRIADYLLAFHPAYVSGAGGTDDEAAVVQSPDNSAEPEPEPAVCREAA